MINKNNRKATLFVVVLSILLSVPMLCGQTPLATDSYSPLSTGDKATVFGKRIIAPYAFAKSAVTAGINQYQDSPEEWGQGMAGYSRRFGHKIANRAVENSIGFLVAAPLHQDPRYFRSGESGLWQRTQHALRSTIVTRTDSGGQTFAAWRFAGNYGAQFVSNAWRPERQTQLSETLVRGTVSIGYDAVSNLIKEFWPDIRKKVFHR